MLTKLSLGASKFLTGVGTQSIFINFYGLQVKYPVKCF